MLLLAINTYFFMSNSVDKKEEEDQKDIQNTESSISVQSDDELSEKIQFWQFFKYKLFIFALFSAFFNLILYTLLEPILSNRLVELGVQEDRLGEFFCIQPFVYAGVSVLVDFLILKYVSKRICLIFGFLIFALGFILIAPSGILLFIEPSVFMTCVGLVILGIG